MPHDRPADEAGIAPCDPDPATAAALLQAVALPLLQLDAARRVAWFNGPAAALFGTGLVAGRALVALGLDEAALCMPVAGTVECSLPGAPERWVRTQSQPLPGGGWLLTLQAVDDRRAATARVVQLEELLDLVRECGRLGVWERDVRSLAGTWDRQVYLYWGLDPAAPAPAFATAVRNIDEADRDTVVDCFQRSLQRAGRYSVRYRVRGFDGQLRRIHSQWVVKDGADGRPERLLGLMMDDTEPFALAQAASQAQSQLELAVELAGIGLWRHDLISDVMHYNVHALRILDIESPDGMVPAAQVRARIHPDDLVRLERARAGEPDASPPLDVEARFRRADGSWRTVMTRRAPQLGSDGQLVAYVGVALDVTERNEQLRRAQEIMRRFELVTRTAGIGWWLSEEGAERASWSPQLRQIFGLDEETPVPTLAEWLTRHVHEADRAAVRQAFADVLAGQRESTELGFRIVRADGQVRHVYTHSRFEAGTRAPTLFGVVVDLTEQRRSELALQSAAERVALAARGAGLGTWELDLGSSEVTWDEQMWVLRGLQPQPRAMSFEQRMACVHPDDRSRIQVSTQAALDAGTAMDHEFRVVWPDGQVRWLASRSTEVHDVATGRRRIGVNWDVTDRRTAETVRSEREAALHESRAKSKFLARMSHELRTPLNAVLGFAQLLLSDEAGSDATALARRRRIEHIHAAGRHLLSLINDVLDLASLQGGEIRIALQPVALAPLVSETLPMLGPLLDARRVDIVRGPLDAVVMADATRLRQALLNLLSNAVKYNRPGGRVTIEALQRGEAVLLRVTDTGRGMSDDQVRHLFEPFNRLGMDEEPIEGTGIGLAIVKALVERMGGSVHVDSTLGVGSVFELRLRGAGGAVRLAAAGEPDAAAAGGPASARRRRVLYVEDNPVNALIVAELMARRNDVELHLAVDGASGVAQAVALVPDLVLLDMQLPDCDGFEVLRRLRADPATAGIPCMALSANAIPEDIQRALRAGIREYWTKPLDFKGFMTGLDRLFGDAP